MLVSTQERMHSVKEAKSRAAAACQGASPEEMTEIHQTHLLFMLVLTQELMHSVKEAKSRAAAACQGASPEEMTALATAIARLPTAQLEAAVQFLAARHPMAMQPQVCVVRSLCI